VSKRANRQCAHAKAIQPHKGKQMTDEEIRQAAREICSLQAQKDVNSDASDYYLNGNYDHTIWMRLVEQGIRKGIEQHEPFKQKVSDEVEALLDRFLGDSLSQGVINGHLHSFVVPKPKPDPLVEVIKAMRDEPTPYVNSEVYANRIRKKLEARGLEIREKGE
jgi:hypothetical protein